ncbi:ATP-binding protein [Streptomyces sp. NPDC048718]|uniref:ATP-binding protein n=1 Tax=Streptomyces sp. NPDC048718 TaxID=3365587 RepID=UPI00371113B6
MTIGTDPGARPPEAEGTPAGPGILSGPAGRASLCRALTDGPEVIAECRDLTRRALRDWFGPDGDPERIPVADALLLVSEVVTNARRHGGAPYEIRLDRAGRTLRVRVSDTSPVPPRAHGPHRPDRTSGHGLFLLRRLATRWGSVPRGSGGKTVWFEVEVPPMEVAPAEAVPLPETAPPGKPGPPLEAVPLPGTAPPAETVPMPPEPVPPDTDAPPLSGTGPAGGS